MGGVVLRRRDGLGPHVIREACEDEGMAGTGYHPEGHQPVPYTGTLKGDVICANCAVIDPEPESECIDDQ